MIAWHIVQCYFGDSWMLASEMFGTVSMQVVTVIFFLIDVSKE